MAVIRPSRDIRDYEDIIHMPHHVSEHHPQMSIQNRAGQFSPYAALVGYGDMVEETGRLVNRKIELTEEQKDRLNRRMLYFQVHPELTVTAVYFVHDIYKDGGSYETYSGTVKRFDHFEKSVYFQSGLVIPMDDLFSLSSAPEMEEDDPVSP